MLYAKSFTALKGDPVSSLVRDCLLEERTGEAAFQYTSPSGGAYTLKWVLNNTMGLVYVAVYQKALKLPYVDELLQKSNKAFIAQYREGVYTYRDFDTLFVAMLEECETRGQVSKKIVSIASESMERVAYAKQIDNVLEAEEEKPGIDQSSNVDNYAPATASGAISEGSAGMAAFDTATISKKLARRAVPGAKTGRASLVSSKKEASKKEPARKEKAARRWDDAGISKEDAAALDYTDGNAGEVSVLSDSELNQRSRVDADEEDEDHSDEDASLEDSGRSLLSSFVRTIGVNVVGTGALTQEDIAPALAELKKKLMERNVAEEIAAKLTESVSKSLEGQRLGSFTRVTSAVKNAVEEALTRILTPQRSVDVLREVRASKGRGRPYTIVFVGVNGVGKSTNLAKVAYWLLQNGASVMIAACDTFRSGAVEQLKTHCARLNVPLFEKGYEKDPAKVAYEAARAAAKSGIDVLLVDTAGRMQDNEPLMRALSSLINLNHPDLVLFVGEALVGNDAVDQLTKFNRRLADLSPNPDSKRLIDGIVLTKFDTIDDKVGAALSMVYTSGAPIMFVGCGQTYVDLKKLNVKSVVRSLLK